MSDFDALLYRPIKPGNEFEKLMPKTTCKMELTGKGMTDLSIKEMAFMVEEYEWQTEEIADLLEKETLEATCKAIHDFAYDHFQYKADEQLQLLRSPACSWYDRQNGIDCKSYSIIASCILTNLGIRHSIRKIKQSGFSPNDWTHVYVVVPKNQGTGNLSDGNYFTIDGTLPTMEEPHNIDKSDLDMLQHARLNGAHQGLNGGINMDTVKGLFSSFACIGGDGFREGEYKWAQEAMIVHYGKLVDSVNASIVAKDFTQLSEDFNEIFGTGKATVRAYELKLSQNNWNPCSTKRLKGMIALSKFYRDTVGAAVTAYISKYFTSTASGGSLRYNASAMEGAPLNFRFIYTDPHVIVDEPVFNYQFLAGTASIPKLEITQYVADNANTPSSFNPATFLQGLSQILVSFQPGSNPNTPNPDVITDPTTGLPIVVKPPPTQLGVGTIVGALIVTAGLAYAFTKTPDKPSSAAKKTLKK